LRTPTPKLAEKMHNLYESLAPKYGYETRLDTKSFDPNSPNGKLMCAVLEEVRKIIEDETLNSFSSVHARLKK
jgi:hypothetical protein